MESQPRLGRTRQISTAGSTPRSGGRGRCSRSWSTARRSRASRPRARSAYSPTTGYRLTSSCRLASGLPNPLLLLLLITRTAEARSSVTGATTCYHQGAPKGANGRQRCLPEHEKTPANHLRSAKNRKSRYGTLPARQAGGHWFEPSTAPLRRSCTGSRQDHAGAEEARRLRGLLGDRTSCYEAQGGGSADTPATGVRSAYASAGRK